MSRQVTVSLLKTVVFLDVVQIVSPDDNRSLHLHALDDPREDASSNAHVASERTLFVDVCALTRLHKCVCVRARVGVCVG